VNIKNSLKLPPLCLAAGLLAACGAPRPAARTAAQVRGAAVVYQKNIFTLVKTPDPELEASLEGLLSASYDVAVKNHSGDKPMEIGFTYSISPRGAVYPFSEVEVSCIMQEKYSRRYGPKLCRDFFGEVGARIRRAVAGKH
jgi:hypothetical protein